MENEMATLYLELESENPKCLGEKFGVQVIFDETEMKQEIEVLADDDLAEIEPTAKQRRAILEAVGFWMLENQEARNENESHLV